MKKGIELLAPAGDYECLKTAFDFGADAVYVGGPMLQLRSDKIGFDIESLKKGVEYAHSLNKKIYVTVNSFVKDSEFDELYDYAGVLNDLKVDAVIVSDLGAISFIHDNYPDLEIHVSTQANCMNTQAVLTYKKMGAKRIVLARETTLDEIRTMIKQIPDDVEIEAFVHGAMCMSYSGRCFISKYLADRSGNRGECTQPCRWNYHLVEMKRPNEFYPVEETEHGTNILSSRDLCCIDFIDELIDAGIVSFKIEGRMKSPFYVATVVNAYRHRIDDTAPLELLKKELECVSHRPYTTGFYYGALKNYAADELVPYTMDCTFAGVVKDVCDGNIIVEQRNKFSVGETLGVVSPRSLGIKFELKQMFNVAGEQIESAPHAQQTVSFKCPEGVNLYPGDLLRVELNQ